MSGVDSGLGLWVFVASVGRSVFTSTLLSAERDWRPLGVEVWWRGPLRGVPPEGSGNGAASGDTGDMMGALTGRLFLSGVVSMATEMCGD